MSPKTARPDLDVSISIRASSGLVMKAFFDADAIGAWWQASRSITVPRVLGPYAVEWKPSEYRDEVLGRLGGIFRGTVMQIDPYRGFFLADSFWLPPDGDPIGPMAMEVTCVARAADDSGDTPTTDVRVVQTGFEESTRWRRYYEIINIGWRRALQSMKMLLEK